MTDELTICARAMAESAGLRWTALPDSAVNFTIGYPDRCKNYWIAQARACLTALSENISEKMVEAGAKAMTGAPFPSRRAKTKAIATCVAMFTAAMGEGE